MLRAWAAEHPDEPAPKGAEIENLMKETGLEFLRIKNWFGSYRFKRKKQRELEKHHGDSGLERMTPRLSQHARLNQVVSSSKSALLPEQEKNFQQQLSTEIPPGKKSPKTGIPEEAEKVLDAWLDKNPYQRLPAAKRKMLMEKTGLGDFQIKTWFAQNRKTNPLSRKESYGSSNNDVASSATSAENDPIEENEENKRIIYSSYRGVTRRKPSNKFSAFIGHRSKTKYLGSFELSADAARAYDKAAEELKGPHWSKNFQTDDEYEKARALELAGKLVDKVNTETSQGMDDHDSASREVSVGNGVESGNASRASSEEPSEPEEQESQKQTSKSPNYHGVTYSSEAKYEAVIMHGPKLRDLGSYKLAADAALAYDVAAMKLKGPGFPLNFRSKHGYEAARRLELNDNGDETENIKQHSELTNSRRKSCNGDGVRNDKQIEESDTTAERARSSDAIDKDASDQQTSDTAQPKSLKPSRRTLAESENCEINESLCALRDDYQPSKPEGGKSTHSSMDVIDVCDSEGEENDDTCAGATVVNNEQSTSKIKNGETNSARFTQSLPDQELYQRKVKQNQMMKLIASQIEELEIPYPEGSLVCHIARSRKSLTKSEKMMLKLRAMERYYGKLHLGRDFDDDHAEHMTDKEDRESIIEGRVVAVWMDLDEGGNVCEIEATQSVTAESNHSSNQSLFIRVKDLHFAPNCEISIQSSHDHWCRGRVVLCNANSQNRDSLYTVQSYRDDGEFQLIKDIDSSRIKYCNLKIRAVTATAASTTATKTSESFDTEHFSYKESSTSTKNDHIAENENYNSNVNSQKSDNSDTGKSVLSNVKRDSKAYDTINEDGKEISINDICDSLARDKIAQDSKFISIDDKSLEVNLSELPHHNANVAYYSSNEKLVEYETVRKKRARSPSSICSANQPSHKQTRFSHSNRGANKILCSINFPKWLVPGSEAGDRLADAMSEARNGLSFLDTVSRDSNCVVRLQTNNSESFCRRYNRFHVTITSNGGSDPLLGGRIAKERIENFLLDHFRHDGSQGRMFYTIAKGAKLFHPRPRGIHGSINQRDPFSRHSQFGWISIVEIPFEVDPYSGRKQFHGDFLIKRKHDLKSRLRKELDCSLKFCGEELDGVRVRYGDPYVCIRGGREEDVDVAFGIIDDEIRCHMVGCRCRFGAAPKRSIF